MDFSFLLWGLLLNANSAVPCYGTAQFKLYTRVQIHTCTSTLTGVKIKKPACTRTVACNFGVRTWDSKHM